MQRLHVSVALITVLRLADLHLDIVKVAAGVRVWCTGCM